MRQTLLSLLFVTLLLASAVCAKPAGDDHAKIKDKDKEPAEREWAVHEDLIHGYKLRYPVEWEVRKGTSETVVVTLVSGVPAEGHSADVVTVSYVEEKKKKLDLETVLQAVSKTAAEGLKEFKVLEKGSASLDGHPAKKLVYVGKAENNVDVETTTIFTLLEDGRFFSITLVSDPERHEEFKPIMKEVLESFKTFEPK